MAQKLERTQLASHALVATPEQHEVARLADLAGRCLDGVGVVEYAVGKSGLCASGDVPEVSGGALLAVYVVFALQTVGDAGEAAEGGVVAVSGLAGGALVGGVADEAVFEETFGAAFALAVQKVAGHAVLAGLVVAADLAVGVALGLGAGGACGGRGWVVAAVAFEAGG